MTNLSISSKPQKLLTLSIERLDLEDNRYEYRVHSNLESLAESLKQDGQLVPIIVRFNSFKKRYQIISGFRRTRASLKAGLENIKAIEVYAKDDEAHRISILENEARKDYNDLDRSNAIKKMKKEGKKLDEISQIMGISKMHINRLEKLVELPETLRKAIIKKELDSSKALILGKLDDINTGVTLDELLQETIQNNLTRSELEKKLKRFSESKNKKVKNQKEELIKITNRFIHLKPLKLSKEKLPQGNEKENIIAGLKQVISLMEGGTV